MKETNNVRNAGRKKVPDGVRKCYVIPEKRIPEVNELVKSIIKEELQKKKV